MSKKIDKSLILSKLKEHYGFKSDSDFAVFLGIKPQTLSSWHTRNTFDFELIYAKCVNLDANFLLTGEGDIEKRNMQNKQQYKSVAKSVAFPDKTKNIKNATLLEDSENGIPLIPLSAMGGWGSGEHQVMEYETKKYVVPEFTELNVDFMIRVKGSSMSPKYNSGDLVACKKLSLNDIFFQWNKVYVLDTIQGALIKRIKKGKENDTLLIISDNERYDPFELHLSQVNSIAIVVGVIRLE